MTLCIARTSNRTVSYSRRSYPIGCESLQKYDLIAEVIGLSRRGMVDIVLARRYRLRRGEACSVYPSTGPHLVGWQLSIW
jgi:hypothetical protein